MSFLFVDRILSLEPGKNITGIKHITQHDLYWQKACDGKNDAFSAPLIGETLGQLAAWNAMFSLDFTHRPVAGVADSVEMLGDAKIGDTLFLSVTIDKLDNTQVTYHGDVKVGDKTILKLGSALGPMLPMSDFCSQDLVKSQFESIYRPGEFNDLPVIEKVDARPYQKVPVLFNQKAFNGQSQSMDGVMLISKSAPFFPDHFPTNPVFPMTLLLKAGISLANDLLKQVEGDKTFQVCQIKKAKMKTFIRPGDWVKCTAKIKSEQDNQRICEIITQLDGQKICVANVIFYTQ